MKMTVTAKFRGISVQAAFDEHGRLLATAPSIKTAMKQAADPEAFADALNGVYATDPNYGETLKWVIQNYGLSQDAASDSLRHRTTPRRSSGGRGGVSDNPFSEPGDADRTVIRPMPGGRRAPATPPVPDRARVAPAPAAAPEPVLAHSGTPAVSVSPLAIAASPLLQLLVQLRNMHQQQDPKGLRDRTVRELREFERRGREAGIAMELLRPAHYALCASIDDIVLNTLGRGRRLGLGATRGNVPPWRPRPRSVLRSTPATEEEP